MQTNFDRFVHSLIAHYNLPTPEKQFDDEVYRFTVNDNMPVKLYGDRNNLVYFVSTLGNYQEKHDKLCSELLKLNNFSLKNPCLTLGLDTDNCLIIHTRLSIMDLKGPQGLMHFENFIDRCSAIKTHLNLE